MASDSFLSCCFRCLSFLICTDFTSFDQDIIGSARRTNPSILCNRFRGINRSTDRFASFLKSFLLLYTVTPSARLSLSALSCAPSVQILIDCPFIPRPIDTRRYYACRFTLLSHFSDGRPFTRPAFARHRRLRGVTLTATLRHHASAAGRPLLPCSGVRCMHLTLTDCRPLPLPCSKPSSKRATLATPHPGGLFSWRASAEPRFAASLFGLACPICARSYSLYIECLSLSSSITPNLGSDHHRHRTSPAMSFRGIKRG
jgi:hypothetical protein